ncbi:unnamed protein product [Rhizoctonia solani]|uniref:Vacuolar protein sorting-associated protein 54 C-terminal domain-containing protein n=1 Tax=Rhizoctonia solani TaxID=456999 RepID=A0A8H2W6G2_9AGAM|nr:unnamed protein product [Rhizoctonia solani]
MTSAISTVLNNPKTRPNPLKSSKAPQPPVNSPDLKRIRRKDFDPYLKAIGPAWQQFERNKSANSTSTTAFGATALPLSPSSDGHNGISSGHSVFSDPSSSDTGTRSTLPSLSGVPSIYFNTSFDLSDPRTFAAVTEQETGASHRRASSSPADIALNHILQEKLSHYMDIVEQHLVQEIAIRSVPFFAALSNLQDLQTEGAACLSRISRLKAQLQDVDNYQARRGLDVVRLQSKRDNLQQLQRAVKDIREVGETVGMAKRLTEEGDHFAALGLIETVQSLLERKENSEPSMGVENATTQTPHYKGRENGDVFSLPTVIESPNTPVVFSQQNTNGTQSQDLQTSRLESPLETSIDLSSLASLSDTPAKLAELRTNVSLALQRDLLALLTEDLVAQTKSLEPRTTATSSETLRSEAWKAQLHVLLDGLLRTSGIERAFTSYKEVALAQIRLLVQAHQANTKGQLNSTENDLDSAYEDNVEFVKSMDHAGFMRLMRSLYSTLLESIRTTQEHGTLIQKTLQDIAEQNEKRSESIELSDECSAVVFAVAELASVCCAKLINARSEQNVLLPWPDFLELYNETSAFNIECEILCRTMIIALRGAANSQAKAYLSAFHSQRISESAKLVEEETWSAVDVSPKYQRLVTVVIEAAVSNPPEILAQSSQPVAQSEDGVGNGSNPKHVTIEEQQFYVVGATLQAIRLIIDYLSIIANLPLLTIDVMPKIIEFLKVVLGAGALRSAGLKNITARHLALASQSLTVMVTLIPYVRETFRRHLSPKQAVMLIEFDKLKRLIMSQVFAAINHRLSEEYGKIDLPTQEAKDRLIGDARYLHGRLSALPGVGGLSSMLETVVSDKRVVVPAPPEPSINTTNPAPVVPAKPARRTLSSIFGKDSKFASKAPPSSPIPTSSDKPESLRPVTEENAETSTKAVGTQKVDINAPGAILPNVDTSAPVDSEEPKGAEEHTAAPAEAMQPVPTSVALEVPGDGKNAHLADETIRVTASSPNVEQSEPVASPSQTASPVQLDGDQPTPQ